MGWIGWDNVRPDPVRREALERLLAIAYPRKSVSPSDTLEKAYGKGGDPRKLFILMESLGVIPRSVRNILLPWLHPDSSIYDHPELRMQDIAFFLPREWTIPSETSVRCPDLMTSLFVMEFFTFIHHFKHVGSLFKRRVDWRPSLELKTSDQESFKNASSYWKRFHEALCYYSNLNDACILSPDSNFLDLIRIGIGWENMLIVCEQSYEIRVFRIHPFFWFVDPTSPKCWRTLRSIAKILYTEELSRTH
jgi:hypothetical protein